MPTLIDTTFTGKDISGGASVYEYTADGDYAIRIQVRLAAVAGDGEYTAWLTLNDGDAQSDDVIGPKTTYPAASGETAFWFATLTLDVLTGDVVNIFVDGLAGDTNEAGTVRIFRDITVADIAAGMITENTSLGDGDVVQGSVVDVGASFLSVNVIPDLSDIVNTTCAKMFSLDTGYLFTDAVPGSPVYEIANNVTVIDLTAEGAAAFFTVDSGETYDSAVDGSVVKEIGENAGGGSGGASASEVWSYATRTLTQTAAQVQDVMTGSTLNILRGDTLSATFTGLASNTGYVAIDLTVKRDKSDADSAAILKIRLNAPSANDGLLYLNGAAPAAPVVASDGSLTVNSATSITAALAARATDELTPEDGLYYDIQYIFATSVQTATEGICNITADVTRAIA